jgi:DNA-binding NarL/FixJ family response regulator
MKSEAHTGKHVLLADDKEDIRSAIRLILEEEAGATVEGEAVDAGSLLELLQDGLVARGNGAFPGEPCWVLLLDWELPGLPPEELLARVRSLAPQLRVVALSSRPEAEAGARRAGADAFVSKGQPPECLLDTLRASVLGCGGGAAGAHEQSRGSDRRMQPKEEE